MLPRSDFCNALVSNALPGGSWANGSLSRVQHQRAPCVVCAVCNTPASHRVHSFCVAYVFTTTCHLQHACPAGACPAGKTCVRGTQVLPHQQPVPSHKDGCDWGSSWLLEIQSKAEGLSADVCFSAWSSTVPPWRCSPSFWLRCWPLTLR